MLILSRPAIYSLELTPSCNNRCPGCSNVYASHREPAVLDGAAWSRILALIGPDSARIRLTGGEPTLHPEFAQILDRATSYEALVTIFTNGRWHDPNRFLAHVRSRGNLAGLLVSLHGSTAEAHEAFTRAPGSFEQTLANLRLAREAGVEVALTCVLTRHNLHQIEDLVQLAQTLAVEHVAFNRYLGPPLPDEPSLPDLARAIEQIEHLAAAGSAVRFGIGVPQCFVPNGSEGCLAGVAYASVDPWGNLHPCSHSPTTAGSLFDQPIEALWLSPIMEQWRANVAPECLVCEAFAACHGGCRANAELRGGQDPLCQGPIRHYLPTEVIHEFPASGYPLVHARLRPESFGYVVLAEGKVLPVVEDARAVIETCNGQATIAEIGERFGQGALDLLGDLWDAGILRMAMPAGQE